MTFLPFQTVIREACDFIHYSNQLFYHDTVAKTKAFQHLHMYIHRIALSVILPPRAITQTEEPISPLQDLVKGVVSFRPGGERRLAAVDVEEIDNSALGSSEPSAKAQLGSLPLAPSGSSGEGEGVTARGGKGQHAPLTKHKSLGSSVTTATSSPVPQRKRSSSFNSPIASSSSPSTSFPSPSPATPTNSLPEGPGTPPPKSATKSRTGKSPLLKQQTLENNNSGPLKSLFSKSDSTLPSGGSEKGGGADAAGGGGGDKEGGDESEWRGLRLDTLRSRIQRLVVLMNLSEPGTIPNPAILASLVDLVRVCTVR